MGYKGVFSTPFLPHFFISLSSLFSLFPPPQSGPLNPDNGFRGEPQRGRTTFAATRDLASAHCVYLEPRELVHGGCKLKFVVLFLLNEI